ncbi:MAG: hypothetical protein IT308_09435 [Anaerolineaceae bacterium]|nr:hypothetical protein [Anaerolineaceae bacterium]
MTALAAFQTRLLSLLGDTAGVRYSTDILNEALAQALEEYSVAIPNLVIEEFTVVTGGREQLITTVPSFLNVLQVVFPYDGFASEQVLLEAFYAYHDGDYLTIYIGGPGVPAAGDVIQIYYTIPHTIENLAGAAGTTVNPAHDSLLSQGGSAFAALLRAAQMVENPGKRVADVENLQKWGAEQRHKFTAALQLLAAGHAHTSPFPAAGWKMDQWDKRK